MEQRLVSVFLTTECDEDRSVSEHLMDYLEGGWRVVEFKSLNGCGAGGSVAANGWIVALLEREITEE